MASQPCKRLKRINELRRQAPHVTKEALHQVLSHVEEHGIPEDHNPKHMRKATQQDLAQWDAYSPLLVTKQLVGVSGQCIPMMFVNLLTPLHACYKQGGYFHDLVQHTVARTGAPSPQKPWSLCFSVYIVYSDECWPANPLSHKSEKAVGVLRTVQRVWKSVPEQRKQLATCHGGQIIFGS